MKKFQIVLDGWSCCNEMQAYATCRLHFGISSITLSFVNQDDPPSDIGFAQAFIRIEYCESIGFGVALGFDRQRLEDLDSLEDSLDSLYCEHSNWVWVDTRVYDEIPHAWVDVMNLCSRPVPALSFAPEPWMGG